jgi:hypothetical protein
MRKPRGRFKRSQPSPEENMERGTASPVKRIEVGMEHTLPDFTVTAKGVNYNDVRRGRATAMQEMKARYRRSQAKK